MSMSKFVESHMAGLAVGTVACAVSLYVLFGPTGHRYLSKTKYLHRKSKSMIRKKLDKYLEINLRQKAREDVLLRNYYDAFLQKYITFFPVISVITMIKYQGRI